MFSQVEQALVEGQVESYGLALLALLATFSFAFRSLPLALVALVPNTIPVLLGAGVMLLAGMRLDVATVMVASTTLGLIDDDTIHLVHAYLGARERGESHALEHALRHAGQPTLLASAILAGGFAVLALSDWVPTRHFGALVAITVAAAVVADLIVLPALLARVAPALAGSPRVHTQEVPG
jgi:predicted RND superfamily exporter protein